MEFTFVWMTFVLLLVLPDNVLLTDEHVGTDYKSERRPPVDCYDIYWLNKEALSGVYSVHPMDTENSYEDFKVYCDMETDNGGWTVFQRRLDGRLDFYRYWSDYKNAFGSPAAEFWLGNDKLYRLTNQRTYELRIDMEDFENETRHAKYDTFAIGDEFTKYKLTLGEYTGNAGDSLERQKKHYFTTRDRDNDVDGDANCAETFTGAWWYKNCLASNLNGQYLGGEMEEFAKGIVWKEWKGHNYSLKKTEMKIRPVF